MYDIDLMIITEIRTPPVLSRNDFAFNNAYIYMVNFIGISQS